MKIRAKTKISRLTRNQKVKVTPRLDNNWEASKKAQAKKGRKRKRKINSQKETKDNLGLRLNKKID